MSQEGREAGPPSRNDCRPPTKTCAHGGRGAKSSAVLVGKRKNVMGNLVFGMMQSLDGYVAGVPGGPELPPPALRSIDISTITSAAWPAACTVVACTR